MSVDCDEQFFEKLDELRQLIVSEPGYKRLPVADKERFGDAWPGIEAIALTYTGELFLSASQALEAASFYRRAVEALLNLFNDAEPGRTVIAGLQCEALKGDGFSLSNSRGQLGETAERLCTLNGWLAALEGSLSERNANGRPSNAAWDVILQELADVFSRHNLPIKTTDTGIFATTGRYLIGFVQQIQEPNLSNSLKRVVKANKICHRR